MSGQQAGGQYAVIYLAGVAFALGETGKEVGGYADAVEVAAVVCQLIEAADIAVIEVGVEDVGVPAAGSWKACY